MKYVYDAYVKNVVDGDTVDVVIDLGFYMKYETRIRLAGINTAEMNSTDPAKAESARKAKDYLVSRILFKNITIETHKKDKYGRFLGEIYADGLDVNLQLLQLGLAEVYKG